MAKNTGRGSRSAARREPERETYMKRNTPMGDFGYRPQTWWQRLRRWMM